MGYENLRTDFRWEIPRSFNIGVACADRQPKQALALIDVGAGSVRREYKFGDLTNLSNRLANGLRGIGVARRDRVAIALPQSPETGIAHLAIYKLGAIAVPMSGLFGPQALTYRMGDCAAKAVITDSEHVDSIAEVAGQVGDVDVIVVDAEPTPPHHGFWSLINAGSDHLTAARTSPVTPALLIYTSGTTGPPKGALHGHGVLMGHLPGFELSHNFFPQPGDRFWTPADWAWIGGLLDALMPSWYHGRPVICAARRGFDPAWALRLMADEGVRNAFLPPTVLKMMREADTRQPRVSLRSVMCGGEPLGEEMLGWARANLGVTVNEIYGQTEANYVVGNCAPAWDVRPGSMGRPYPGHEVTVLTPDLEPAGVGCVGEIAVRAPDPVIFQEYWGRPDATHQKFTADSRWLRTGDLAQIDADGYLWFESRSDDVINSAGYRIGPAEIEECLMHHPAVAMAAVVGIPDPIRGQAIKAFIQLRDQEMATEGLERDIQQLVRRRLAAYEYPRQIEFVSGLPLTVSGKIRRGELRVLEERRFAQRANAP